MEDDLKDIVGTFLGEWTDEDLENIDHYRQQHGVTTWKAAREYIADRIENQYNFDDPDQDLHRSRREITFEYGDWTVHFKEKGEPGHGPPAAEIYYENIRPRLSDLIDIFSQFDAQAKVEKQGLIGSVFDGTVPVEVEDDDRTGDIMAKGKEELAKNMKTKWKAMGCETFIAEFPGGSLTVAPIGNEQSIQVIGYQTTDELKYVLDELPELEDLFDDNS